MRSFFHRRARRIGTAVSKGDEIERGGERYTLQLGQDGEDLLLLGGVAEVGVL